MRNLVFSIAAGLLVSLAVVPIAAQSSSHRQNLEGLWSNETLTPLERPRELAGKEFFTALQLANQVLAQLILDAAACDPLF